MADQVPLPPNTARTSFTPLPSAKQAGSVYVAPLTGSKEGWTHAHTRQTILAEPETLYAMWSKVAEFPRWQEHVISVTPTGEKTSHWVVGNPDLSKKPGQESEQGEQGKDQGKRAEFDSEIVDDVPNKRIAWQSTGGDIEQNGSVEFTKREDGRGTLVTLVQHVKANALMNAIVSLSARGVGQTTIENLRHFKALAETGEIPTVAGQPHGPRGAGKVQEWMLGETNPTPPGTSDQA